MSQLKATIIGSNGFIGSHLSSKLFDLGWDCYTPDKHVPYDKQENMGHVF